MDQQPQQILKSYFGYDQFRPQQEDIIRCVLAGQDTLALLPTGGGKSLCYQVPALLLSGLTIVISPLISLMQDQVDHLLKRHIPATTLHSNLSPSETQRRWELLTKQKYKLLYISPERLSLLVKKSEFSQLNLSLLAIDEAHCISEWGHDFRPEYRMIHEVLASLRTQPKRLPILAVTATATPTVIQDIASSLNLTAVQIFTSSFERTNLTIVTGFFSRRSAKMIHLLHLLKKHSHQCGIIYVTTREDAVQYAQWLNGLLSPQSLPISSYHGGMSAADRTRVQAEFMSGKSRLIVATNAFGMGIDKGDIRFVIHAGLPSSVEQYYQEIGRAGRDGFVSWCYLLINAHDIEVSSQLLKPTNKPLTKSFDADTQHLYFLRYHKFQTMLELFNATECKHNFVLRYFGQRSLQPCATRCQSCDHSVSLPEQVRQSFDFVSTLQQLHNLRHTLALLFDIPEAEVITTSAMTYLALLKPQSWQATAMIPGLGLGWLTRWYNSIQPLLTSPESSSR